MMNQNLSLHWKGDSAKSEKRKLEIQKLSCLVFKELVNAPKPHVATQSVEAEAGTSSSKDDITGGSTEAEKNKLVFFNGRVYSFDLKDLLRASADVLGKESMGTSYKVVLEEGTTVVVKRLKDVVVTKREFEMTMEVIGKIKHDNVVSLRAFYFSKDKRQ
ncbi:hypothetical protein ACFX2C_006696 [Malus domestica]